MEKDTGFYSLIIEKVKECGEILKNADENKSEKEKSDGSLVTKYDLLVDEKLTNDLKSICNIPVLSEEHKEELTDTYFVIDPIDGTHNFINGLEYYGIMVAYVENNVTVFSVVHIPMLNKTFTAYKGKGAYLNGKQIHVRKNEKRFFGATNVDTEISMQNIQKLLKSSKYYFEFRLFFCVCVPIPYIASGNLDFNIYAVSCGLWDILTTALILEEAGGYIEYTKIGENKYQILAGTKEACEAIKETLQ